MAIISWYTLIGLLAQLAFMSRMLVQWIMSERARKVVNPALFWWLSLFGALTMSFYGFLRQDLAILLGQLVSFYVYIYNLKLKGKLFKISKVGAVAVILTPLVLLALELRDTEAFAANRGLCRYLLKSRGDPLLLVSLWHDWPIPVYLPFCLSAGSLTSLAAIGITYKVLVYQSISRFNGADLRYLSSGYRADLGTGRWYCYLCAQYYAGTTQCS